MRAVLIDTGPLVALLDNDDNWHRRCRDALALIHEPLLTTWPVLTEASYLLDNSEPQSMLLQMIERESIQLVSLERNDVARIRELMVKYADLPMDLADATLVRVAERDHISRVFTLDRRDFEIYRPAGIPRFRIVP